LRLESDIAVHAGDGCMQGRCRQRRGTAPVRLSKRRFLPEFCFSDQFILNLNPVTMNCRKM
jgi:hypothetical protein